MNNNMIEGAELTIYSVDGENFSINLSNVQLFAVCKVLGLRFRGNNEISHITDSGLKKIIENKTNIWDIVLKNNEQD